MKIGILQTGHSPEEIQQVRGDYDTMFAKLLDQNSFDFVTYNVVDSQFPEGPGAADGWLITGSKHGAYEKHPWIEPLEALIRDIVASGRPLIGVCFGHQIIAQALGGKVEKFSGGWGVGATEYVIDDLPTTLNAWHQDQVTSLPQSARVIGGNDFCHYAALAYGDNVLTYQAHPEFDNVVIEKLIELRGKGVVNEALLDAARGKLDMPTSRDRIARRIAEHFLGERTS